MNKKALIVALLLSIVAIGTVFAYHSGFCQKSGCYCYQYEGSDDDGGWDRCGNCGHYKVNHS